MTIHEALPDVHFRFSDDGRVIRCCGVCGAELDPGAQDPCTDALTCWERQFNTGVAAAP
jgi:hypothetical protein